MGKRTQSRLETHRVLFDAAVDLFDSQGYGNTSVEEICDAAGVGRATFFRHFETKAGLLREYNRRLADDAKQRIGDLQTDDVRSRLQAVSDAIHDAWVGAGPGLRELGADAASLADPTGRRVHPELLDLVVDVVRRGRADGELSTLLPAPLSGYLVVTYLAAAAGWWYGHPDDDFRELLDHALEQCLTGMAASSTSDRKETDT